jgi:hypothetical protein
MRKSKLLTGLAVASLVVTMVGCGSSSSDDSS